MRIDEIILEDATPGSTSAANIATLNNPSAAKRKLKKKTDLGVPEAPQLKNPDGTVKNALDVDSNIFGAPLKR
jgi:hypothetical protein